MRSHLRTLFFTTAAVGAAVVLFVSLTVPPKALRLGPPAPPTAVTGAYHVHSNRSDGTGTVDEIAAAAAAAGLQFVIFTDHGDGTRAPDPPAYRFGVLCIDAVEINTASGHVVALGLNAATPYPLAGTAADVIDDIHRLGGLAVVAHPDSPRFGLRWRGTAVPFDGIEWLNADSEWRDETAGQLLLTAARGMFRPPEVMATLFATPVRTFERWDRAARQRAVFGLAALDAHANIGWRDDDEPRGHTALARPGYRTMFETVGQTALLDAPLSGRAAEDARRVLAALTTGRSFSIVRAFAAPAMLNVIAVRGDTTAPMGARLAGDMPVTFRADVPQAPGARLTLVHDGRPVASGLGRLEFEDPNPQGVYRVDVRLTGHDLPWLVSNPITIAGPDETALPELTDEPAGWLDLRADDVPWTVEHDPSSTGRIELDGGALRFSYRLGPGTPSGQYAALVASVGNGAGIDRVRVTARADRPIRASLQVRLPQTSGATRWRRSIHLDTTPRVVTVPLERFDPADGATSRRPIVAPLHSVLIVVDTLNSHTGSEGTIWVSDAAVGVRDMR